MIGALVLVAALSFVGMLAFAIGGDPAKSPAMVFVMLALFLVSITAAFIGYEAGWFR